MRESVLEENNWTVYRLCNSCFKSKGCECEIIKKNKKNLYHHLRDRIN